MVEFGPVNGDSMAIQWRFIGDFGEIGLGNINARQSGIDQTKPSPMLKTTGPSIYLSSGASLGAASEMRAPLISLPAFSLPPIWGTSLHVKRLERLDYAKDRHKIAPCSDCLVRVGLDWKERRASGNPRSPKCPAILAGKDDECLGRSDG